jgi:hypothetical protein
MKAGLSGREPLNGAAEPGGDLLEVEVLDVAKSVRPKDHLSWTPLVGPRMVGFKV